MENYNIEQIQKTEPVDVVKEDKEYVCRTHGRMISCEERIGKHFECECIHIGEVNMVSREISRILKGAKVMRMEILKEGSELYSNETKICLEEMIEKLMKLEDDIGECIKLKNILKLSEILVESRKIK